MAGKLETWRNAFWKEYEKLADKEGHKDSLDSIVGDAGQRLVRRATSTTNSSLGYTESDGREDERNRPTNRTGRPIPSPSGNGKSFTTR